MCASEQVCYQFFPTRTRLSCPRVVSYCIGVIIVIYKKILEYYAHIYGMEILLFNVNYHDSVPIYYLVL